MAFMFDLFIYFFTHQNPIEARSLNVEEGELVTNKNTPQFTVA